MREKKESVSKIDPAHGRENEREVVRNLYLASLLEQISDALISTDMDFRVLEWNVAAENMYGWKSEEAVGHITGEIIQTEYPEGTRDQAIQDVIKNGSWKGEVTQKRKNGERFPVLASVSLVKDQEGVPIGFVTINRDISERKQAEKVLQNFIDKNPVAIQIVDKDGFIVKVNPAHTRLFGSVPPAGYSMFRSFQNRPKEVRELFERAINNGEVVHFPDLYSNAHDVNPEVPDVPVWIRATCFPINDEHENLEQLVFTYEDITERKQAEKQIVQMKRLYATLSQVNQTIVRVKSHADLYQSICDVSTKFGEFVLAWIGLLDTENGEIRPVAASGMDVAHWPFPIISIKDGAHPNGVVAEAILTSKVMTSEDIQTDERTKSLHNNLQKHNFHSLACIPFRLRGKTIGVLNLISSETGDFKAEAEIKLLDEMGLDISFALDTIENEAERLQAEQMLRESEQKFSSIFNKSVYATTLSKLPDGVLVDVNEAFEQEFGYTRQEAIGKTSLEIGFNPDAEVRARMLAEIKEHGSARNHELPLRTKSNETRIFSVNVDLVDIGDQKYILNTTKDITEQKRAEEERDKLIERLDLATHVAQMGIWDWHIEKNELVWDDRMYVLYGLRPGDFGGAYEAWLNGVHPDDREASNEASQQAMRGEKEYDAEFRVLWRDGSVHWLKANG